jgi:hypothetical protein
MYKLNTALDRPISSIRLCLSRSSIFHDRVLCLFGIFRSLAFCLLFGLTLRFFLGNCSFASCFCLFLAEALLSLLL